MQFIKTDDNKFSVVANDQIFGFGSTHPKFEELKNILMEGSEDEFEELFNSEVDEILEWSEGNFHYKDGVLSLEADGQTFEIPEVLTRITERMMAEGEEVSPFLNFVEKLMENP